MEMKDAVAVVTGGTGGLGGRICSVLASKGVHVAVCYARSEDKAVAVARKLEGSGNRGIPVQVDVTQEDSVERMVDEVMRVFGRIDILVNDAGINKWLPYPDLKGLKQEDWACILAVNLTGPFLCAKHVGPIMKRQGRGRIINISSLSGLGPTGSSIPYDVSKGGLIQLTKCLARALAPEVLVNCVAPGFMEGTRATEKLAAEHRQRAKDSALLKRAADKEDIAGMVVECCRTESMTGQTIVIDGGRVFH
jgi:3-oxoacyl-[acyl-carrier protein] reductase